MRKLASIRKIDEIRPILDADAIECAVVGGWTVVVKKGEFYPGDFAIYIEIDSWVPYALAPFLSKGKDPREYEGVLGERLRTVRLRGQVSQGLLLPFEASLAVKIGAGPGAKFSDYAGIDVSEMLGIIKWEPPIPAQIAGEVLGFFPSFIPKTDQERIQNLSEELKQWLAADSWWEVTEKLDGTSMTVYLSSERFGVCSRNLDLKPNPTNSLWKAAYQNGLDTKLPALGRQIAIQGELIGEGIQGNPYNLKGQEFYVFSIYDIVEARYLLPNERWALVEQLGVKHVPILELDGTLDNMEHMLKKAEAKSQLNPSTEREGLVYKSLNSQESFKCISNKFLLKHGG